MIPLSPPCGGRCHGVTEGRSAASDQIGLEKGIPPLPAASPPQGGRMGLFKGLIAGEMSRSDRGGAPHLVDYLVRCGNPPTSVIPALRRGYRAECRTDVPTQLSPPRHPVDHRRTVCTYTMTALTALNPPTEPSCQHLFSQLLNPITPTQTCNASSTVVRSPKRPVQNRTESNRIEQPCSDRAEHS